MACRSLEGFQSLSSWIKRDAPMTVHALISHPSSSVKPPVRATYCSSPSRHLCSRGETRLRKMTTRSNPVAKYDRCTTVKLTVARPRAAIESVNHRDSVLLGRFPAKPATSRSAVDPIPISHENAETHPSKRQYGYFCRLQCVSMRSNVEV
jgi:hypothetical protein